MHAPHRNSVAVIFFLHLFLSGHASPKAQTPEPQALASISGSITDSDNRPLGGVEVRLLSELQASKATVATTDGQGRFHFDAVPADSYTLRTNRDGFQQATEGPFLVRAGDSKSFVLRLTRTPPSSPNGDDSAAIPFSDEPHFTVAGVTDTTALGVHASSRTMPNSNALAKDTVALSHEGGGPPSSPEAALRAKLAAADDADLRFQLAEIEEREGHALEAEKDYQGAADLAPTEAHLFAWGGELLFHHAFEPALEVFRKGNRLYPSSARMLLGLGATYYAQGSRDDAAQFFLRASDLDPANPQPYLFLGRLLSSENVAPPAWVDAMKRFVSQHPKNAAAHYLYGLVLAKQGVTVSEAEIQLTQAMELDPQFGDAYLQLGILKSNRKDYTGAVVALQKAIEYTPLPDEAHYRLAEVYRRAGDTEKARQETALYKQISEQRSQQADRERHDLQQFIYTLSDSTATPGKSATPNPY